MIERTTTYKTLTRLKRGVIENISTSELMFNFPIDCLNCLVYGYDINIMKYLEEINPTTKEFEFLTKHSNNIELIENSGGSFRVGDFIFRNYALQEGNKVEILSLEEIIKILKKTSPYTNIYKKDFINNVLLFFRLSFINYINEGIVYRSNNFSKIQMLKENPFLLW